MRGPLPDLWHLLGGDPTALGRLHLSGPAQTLRSTLPITEAGVAAVGASLVAATLGTGARLDLDTRQLAIAMRSERYLRRDGASVGACGIAVLEATAGGADGAEPGALPAQLLDHATGYLAAAGALLAVAGQRATGGTPHVRFSLLGTAQWLLGLPRTETMHVPEVDAAPYLQDIDAPDGRLTLATPPGTVAGVPLRWPSPAPSYGTATPTWWPE